MTPDEFTNQELSLDVGDGHQLYVHDWGKQSAKIPIIYLHGGPGNGVDDRDKAKFDPELNRVIFHDQRGAGKSLPTGGLEHNTTDDLVADIDRIADHLKLDKFVLVGGSWGSTLSLAYGIAHPERVAAMILDGIFTACQDELDWLEKGGWRDFFPDTWQDYQATVPSEYRDNPSAHHYKHVFGEDPEAAKKSSYAYISMELAILKLDSVYKPAPYDKFEPGGGLIEMHYISNKCFMPDGFIVQNAAKLTMPIWLIQGRYDMVCPPRAAHRLQAVLPDGHLLWTINGHMRQHEATNIQDLLIKQATGVE